jgi:hypothetical protein
MRKIVLILDAVAFIASVVWAIMEPGYEPFIAAVTTLAVFLAITFAKKKSTSTGTNKADGKSTILNQSAGDHSTQYQAKGDININK